MGKIVCKRVHTLLQLSDQRLSLRLTLVCVSKTECKLRVLAGLNLLINQVIYSFLPLSPVLSVSSLSGLGIKWARALDMFLWDEIGKNTTKIGIN